jgi:hypothetical protein
VGASPPGGLSPRVTGWANIVMFTMSKPLLRDLGGNQSRRGKTPFFALPWMVTYGQKAVPFQNSVRAVCCSHVQV